MEIINYDITFNNKTERLEIRPYYESGKEMPENVKQLAIEQIIYESYNRHYLETEVGLQCLINVDNHFNLNANGGIVASTQVISFSIPTSDCCSFLEIYKYYFSCHSEEKTIDLSNIVNKNLIKNKEQYKQYKAIMRVLYKDDEDLLIVVQDIIGEKITLDDLIDIEHWNIFKYEEFCYKLQMLAFQYTFKKSRILKPNIQKGGQNV